MLRKPAAMTRNRDLRRPPCRRVVRAARLAGALVLFALFCPVIATAEWTGYLGGPTHSSYARTAQAITVANAAEVTLTWHFTPDMPTLPGQPGVRLYSTPAVFEGRVYIGADNGYFYALALDTGNVLWRRFIGFRPRMTCSPQGFVATAAIAPDPISLQTTVYVSAPDGNLYALNAADGTDVWPPAVVAAPSVTVNDYFPWSSPTVADGHVYVGVASQCDRPLVRGSLEEFDQATGRLLATYWTVPPTALGGGIWTSAAVSPGGMVFVATGNEGSTAEPGDSLSLVRLDESLTPQSRWMVPPTELGKDHDFSSSPTLFSAPLVAGGARIALVGACDKNGLFYALRARRLNLGPVWSLRVGDAGPCLPAAIWNGSRLFVAGSTPTTIGGVAHAGSLRKVNPATGRSMWQRGFRAPIAGTPALDGAGVIALATMDRTPGAPNAAYLVEASTGKVLARLGVGNSPEFAQPVFAGKQLLLASFTGLYAYAAP